MNSYNDEKTASEQKDQLENNQTVPDDHPGLQKMVKNENPRANENLPDETNESDTPNNTDTEAGSEITDGEDG